jgi:hypothetical protein
LYALVQFWIRHGVPWRDPRFKRVDSHELPGWIRDYFHEYSDDFTALGYRHVADVFMEAMVFKAYTRHFLSPAGQIHGGIYCTFGGLTGRNQGRSCEVLLDDGGYAAMTTASLKDVGETAFPMTMIQLPDAPASDLHDAAIKYLEIQFDRGARPMVITDESIFDLKLYAHRLMGWHLATRSSTKLPVTITWQSPSYQTSMAQSA